MRAVTMALAGMALTCCRAATAGTVAPADARLWTAGDLALLDETLARSGEPYTQFLNSKTHGALLLRRTTSGTPELHGRLNDFFVVLAGEGEVEVGGSVTGERSVAPGEKRGETLTGGVFYRIKRGDVLFVPAGHWLQVFIGKGEVLTAIIIKAQ